jgi:branched-subunit amino acid aminotransferase/4-amino-4-deoxychorismate lyase
VPARTRWAKAKELNDEPALFHAKTHLRKLCEDFDTMGVSCDSSVDDILLFVTTALKKLLRHHFSTGVRYIVRVASRGEGIKIFIDSYAVKWNPREGVRACFIRGSRERPRIKGSGVLVSTSARREAHERGFDDALLVDSAGILREGAWSNVFWVDAAGAVFTTDSGIYPGIIRKLLLEREKILLRDIKAEDLLSDAVTEVFVTQATSLITPVITLNETSLARGMTASHTKRLMELMSSWIEKEGEPVMAD